MCFLQTLDATLLLQGQSYGFFVALGNGPWQTGDSVGVDPRLSSPPTDGHVEDIERSGTALGGGEDHHQIIGQTLFTAKNRGVSVF